MSGGLKVGDLFAVFAVKVNTSTFLKESEKVVKAVEKVGKQLKEVGSFAQAFGTALGGAFTAAAVLASKSNTDVEEQVVRVKNAFTEMATEVGSMLIPVIKSLADTLAQVTNWFRGLSPETREAITHWVRLAAELALAGVALGKFGSAMVAVSQGAKIALELASAFQAVGGAGGLLKAIPSFFSAMYSGAINAAVAFGPIILLVGALVLGFGAAYKAWNDSSSGMKDGVKRLWETFKDYFSKIGNFVSDVLNGILDVFTAALRAIFGFLAKAAEKVGLDDFAKKLQGWSEDFTSDAVKKAIAKGAEAAGEAISFVGKKTKAALDYSIDGLKQAAGDLFKGITSQSTKLKLSTESERFQAKAVGPIASSDKYIEDLMKRKGGVGDVLKAYQGAVAKEAKAWADELRAARQRMVDAAARASSESLGQMKDALLGRFSELGNQFAQGLAAGGPELGLAQAGAYLLSQSAQMQQVMEIINGVFQQVADAVGALVEPWIPMLASISDLLKVVLKPIAGLFGAIGTVLAPLAPVIEMVSLLFEKLAPIFQVFDAQMEKMLAPLKSLGDDAMKALFEALKGAALGLITAARAVGELWNALSGALSQALGTLANFSFFGGKPFAGLQGLADAFEAQKVDLSGYSEAQKALLALTWGEVDAKLQANAAQLKNNAALAQATASLNNVPSGVKVALNRFLAISAGEGDDGAGGAPAAASGSSTSSSTGGANSGGGAGSRSGLGQGAPSSITVIVPGEVVDAKFRVSLKNDSARRTGGSLGISSRFSEAL